MNANRKEASAAVLILMLVSMMPANSEGARFTQRIPSDCDWVQKGNANNLEAMEYFYVQTCGRDLVAPSYKRLKGVRWVFDNVIWVPTQSSGEKYNHKIGGYMCSGQPKRSSKTFWQCTIRGWE
jgi:hypothetical protein